MHRLAQTALAALFGLAAFVAPLTELAHAASRWPVRVDAAGGTAPSLAGAEVRAIANAPNGDVLIAGSFRGTLTFPAADPGAPGASLTSAGESDIFVARYDSAGDFLWAVRAGGGRDDVATDIAVHDDGSGNEVAYVVGTFRASASFGSTVFVTGGQGELIAGKDYFVAKLDTSQAGAGQWAWAASSQRLLYMSRNEDVKFPSYLDEDGERLDLQLSLGAINNHGSATQTYFRTQIARQVKVDVDAAGNVYVGGSFRGALLPENSPDLINAKLEDFPTHFQTYPLTDEAVFASGCLYGIDRSNNEGHTPRQGDGGGGTGNGCFFNVFVEKYDVNGQQKWLRQGGSDAAGANARCGICSGQFNDTTSLQIDRDWLFNQQSNQRLTDLAVKPDGRVFVVGTSDGHFRDLDFSTLIGTNGVFEITANRRSLLRKLGSFVSKLAEDGTGTPSWRWLANLEDQRGGFNSTWHPLPDPQVAVRGEGNEVWIGGVYSPPPGGGNLDFFNPYSFSPQLVDGPPVTLNPPGYVQRMSASGPAAFIARLTDLGLSSSWDWVTKLDHDPARCDAVPAAPPAMDHIRLRSLEVGEDGAAYIAGSLAGRLTGGVDPDPLCTEPRADRFAPSATLPVGAGPTFVTQADLGGDATPELVVVNFNGNSVTVLSGDPVSGYVTAATIPGVGSAPPMLAAADLDGDLDLDLAVPSFNTHEMYVLWNEGGFTFTVDLLALPLQAVFTPSSVAAVDLDGVNGLDLVVANRNTDNVTRLINDGVGTRTFTTIGAVPAGDGPAQLVVEDFDGDSIPDLAVANQYADTISVLRGLGGGAYEPPVAFPIGDRPIGAVVAEDLDGDGHLDLATAGFNSGDVSVLLGDGSGDFADAIRIPAGNGSRNVAATDLDGDGNLDLLVSNEYSHDVTVIGNAGGGVFAQVATLPAGLAALGVHPIELDADPTPEAIAVTNLGPGTLTILTPEPGELDGNFQRATTLDLGPGIDSSRDAEVADFDGDGQLELAVLSNVPSGQIAIFDHDGAQGFVRTTTIPISGDIVDDMVAGDFDGDGRIDLMGTKPVPRELWLFQNNGGSWSAQLKLSGFSYGPNMITAGDFDGDGDLDVMVGKQNGTGHTGILNNGNGTFTSQGDGSIADNLFENQLADFDQDGDLDLLTLHGFSTDQVQYRDRNANGSLGGPVSTALGVSSAWNMEVADLDGDGDLDVAVAGDPVSVVLRSSGNPDKTVGVSQPPFTVVPLPAGSQGDNVAALDADGDGDLDLAVADGSALKLLRNAGDGTFTLAGQTTISGGAPGLGELIAADLDGDGDVDPGVTNFLGSAPDGGFTVFWNDAGETAFVAKLADADGSAFDWVRKSTAGVFGGSVDVRDMAVDAEGTARLVGRLSGAQAFGMDGAPSQTVLGDRVASYAAQIDNQGEWFRLYEWKLGEPLVPPAGADATQQPTVDVPGVADSDSYFYWDAQATGGPALYAVRRTLDAQGESLLASVAWRLDGASPQDEQRIVQQGEIVGPDPALVQAHVLGAPVDLSNAVGVTVIRVLSSESGGTLTGGLFSAGEGLSVVLFVEGSVPDENGGPVKLLVVETSQAEDPGAAARQACTVGVPIPPDPGHDDEGVGRNGFVLNADAPIDGAGSTAAYDPATRLGRIIPVNTGDVDIAWYAPDPVSGVAWPGQTSHYTCSWPASPPRIVIASTLGSDSDLDDDALCHGEACAPLLGSGFVQPTIYHQPDPNALGFNPNDEHALLAPSHLCSALSAMAPEGPVDPRCTGSPRPQAVFALRYEDDPGARVSDPYTLVRYYDSVADAYAFLVYQVVDQEGAVAFDYAATAGRRIFPPYPLTELQVSGCADTRALDEDDPRLHLDHNGDPWARSEGPLSVGYFYPLQADFYEPGASVGDCVPFLDQRPTGSTDPEPQPLPVHYQISWPAGAPTLFVGETLLGAKNGLPAIDTQAAVTVVYDPVLDCDDSLPGVTCQAPLPLTGAVQVIDPTSERTVPLAALPPEFGLGEGAAVQIRVTGPYLEIDDPDFPLDLETRVFYDDTSKRLGFRGEVRDEGAGDPLLLPNVMSPRDRAELRALSTDAAYRAAVDALFYKTRNPQDVDGPDAGSDPDPVLPGEMPLVGLENAPGGGIQPRSGVGVGNALTAGAATGTGYVTLAFNDHPSAGSNPVSLEVIQVQCDPYQGQLAILPSGNVFDERLTLRHSGDFGGAPERYEFQWYLQPDVSGVPPEPPQVDPNDSDVVILGSWQPLSSVIPAQLGGDPLSAGVSGAGQGELRFTIEGSGSSQAARRALVDNWLVARYREVGGGVCGWSPFAGSPAGTRADPEPQLAEGWVKRVVLGLNAFDARVEDFHASPTQTYASLLTSAGERFEGPIALNPEPENLNQVGLIEAYGTATRRARELTIDAADPLTGFSPANNALLLATGRIADLYVMLGNEAFADASDPTIGFTTASGAVGTLAPGIFAFQNQVPSLLGEELVLLRGRDDLLSGVTASPFYNRFEWNFTAGDGELAYVQNYNLSDQNGDGFIDEADARMLFPQGHGDAWGHYLTAIMAYYALLTDTDFDWEPRVESVLVAGTPVPVDYEDERKFARAAAARARTGAEIVDLTYRDQYVEDPAGQWQGYTDPDPDRAWGLAGWARRAGKGAYYDWVVANSLLPSEDPDATHTGIQKIDRTTVGEIGEISVAFLDIQQEVDEADRGLNPLGLAKGVVPFDIDPSQIDAGLTHFEQVQERALKALDNAVDVFDYANELSNRLRENQDSVDDFANAVEEREQDFENRLLELFGTPYPEDIGPGGTYPSGYEGPDLVHYMIVEQADLSGAQAAPTVRIRRSFDLGGLEDFGLTPPLQVDFDLSRDDFAVVKNPAWAGRRQSPGEIQLRLSELRVAQAEVRAAVERIDAQISAMRDLEANIDAQQALDAAQLTILRQSGAQEATLDAQIRAAERARDEAVYFAETAAASAQAAGDCMAAFVSSDDDTWNPAETVRDNILSGVACAEYGDAVFLQQEGIQEQQEGDRAVSALEGQKEAIGNATEISLRVAESCAQGETGSQCPLRPDPPLRTADELRLERIAQSFPEFLIQVDVKSEIAQRAAQAYLATVARAKRLVEDRAAFRRAAAAQTQDARYRDVAFRVFRNDAIQKYRASFDLAARYAYLAATAYDYETNLLSDQNGAGESFLTDIVKQRSLGQVIGGQPVPGSRGLADPLARLSANFAVQKGQLGFNNPQTETNRFSLRNEHFRKEGGVQVVGNASSGYQLVLDAQSDDEWRALLREHAVGDLWEVPEFRRFARPFAEEFDGAGSRVKQPGLVIPFDTTVEAGANFFGEKLGPGDSAYDATNFATKVRSVGVWLSNYECLPLSNTPRVYLIPAGLDILRSPEAGNFATREWAVVDQSLPVPFPVGALQLESPDWIPTADSLSEPFGKIRRLSSFRAFPDGAEFDPLQTTSDSRLIGRSVWNTRWLLIIPAQNLLFDADAALDLLIDGQDPQLPNPPGCDDASGLKDIRLFFQTYSISGN